MLTRTPLETFRSMIGLIFRSAADPHMPTRTPLETFRSMIGLIPIDLPVWEPILALCNESGFLPDSATGEKVLIDLGLEPGDFYSFTNECRGHVPLSEFITDVVWIYEFWSISQDTAG
jgi:hypothetical protein